MTLAQSFTTYWGNALMGIHVQWGNDASATSSAVTSSTKLTAIFDLKLYAAGTTTQTGTGNFENDNTMFFYLLILNPNDIFDQAADGATNIIDNDMVGFDGVKASFECDMGTADGTTSANTITLSIDGSGDAHASILEDMWCQNTLSEGQYDATKCFADTDTTIKIAGGVTTDWSVTSGVDAVDYC